MAGALRMIGKVENAITKQVTQRMVESEPWFEERTNQVNALQVFSRIFCMNKKTPEEFLKQERSEHGTVSNTKIRLVYLFS